MGITGKQMCEIIAEAIKSADPRINIKVQVDGLTGQATYHLQRTGVVSVGTVRDEKTYDLLYGTKQREPDPLQREVAHMGGLN